MTIEDVFFELSYVFATTEVRVY